MAFFDWRQRLCEGLVIPAHPLALTAARKLDERRQRGLTRYYLDAGAGGVAMGVHTTQFAIRDHGLYEPVLELASEEVGGRDIIKIAGVCGARDQALREAGCAVRFGYDAVLLSFASFTRSSTNELIAHARTVGEVIPLIGFYLQPAVGGRVLDANFWRQFASLDHISNGRVAWNIVTSWLATAAGNFGGAGQTSHADRYARAEEFMTVVKALWDSWADDAVIDE